MQIALGFLFLKHTLKAALGIQQKETFERYKLVQMGEMIGNISHQWRQPLSKINSVLMSIETNFKKDKLTKETLNEKILKIEDLTSYMSNTIDDFNNFFKQDKEKQNFLVSDSINKALLITNDTFVKENIKVELDFIDDIHITNFKGELIQALIVLLQNAKDAIDTNKHLESKITITTKIQNKNIQILVLDNGGGIDEDLREKIFEPYFTTKFKSNGIGIGLYMAKVIIENNMKGQLAVSNKRDGAEFSITLPTI